jgi:hypothetical protein
VNMITIPETTFTNANPEIFLSKAMKNTLIMYINNENWETCYVDTDVAMDSDRDWKTYNVEFKEDFWLDLVSDYEQIILEYNQSQRNAASSDLSPQLKKMKWVLEEVKTTIRSSGKVSGKKELGLEYRLRKIADKQCVR